MKNKIPSIAASCEGRNYPEDYSLENGNYTCTCIVCRKTFIGHKRRIVCKACFEKE